MNIGEPKEIVIAIPKQIPPPPVKEPVKDPIKEPVPA